MAALCAPDASDLAAVDATLRRYTGSMAEMEQQRSRADKLDSWRRFPLTSARGLESWRMEMVRALASSASRTGKTGGVEAEADLSVVEDVVGRSARVDGSNASRHQTAASPTGGPAQTSLSSHSAGVVSNGALARIAPLDRRKYF